MQERFQLFTDKITQWLGSLPVLIAAVALVTGWLLTGPLFNFSTSWQLFINTFTTITTFLMVFVIQNSSNRDSKALHIKLDALISSLKEAPNKYIGVQQEPEEKITEAERELLETKEEGV